MDNISCPAERMFELATVSATFFASCTLFTSTSPEHTKTEQPMNKIFALDTLVKSRLAWSSADSTRTSAAPTRPLMVEVMVITSNASTRVVFVTSSNPIGDAILQFLTSTLKRDRTSTESTTTRTTSGEGML